MASKGKISSVLNAQIDKLVEYALKMEAALCNTGHPDFFIPDVSAAATNTSAWTGDTLDIDSLNSFSREELATQFRNAVKDANNPGAVGDMITTILQGDFLAQMERAFRLRHSTAVRLRMHSAGRHRGHGHVNGVFRQGLTNYLKQLLKLASG